VITLQQSGEGSAFESHRRNDINERAIRGLSKPNPSIGGRYTALGTCNIGTPFQ
jgi:hypothetical protein